MKYLIDYENSMKGGTSKKKERPSPSESATLFKEGTKKKGNDGNMYVIIVDKNGINKWKKFTKEKNDRPSPDKSSTKKIKINTNPNYPTISVNCYLDKKGDSNLLEFGNFMYDSNEFKDFKKIEKNCKLVDISYDKYDFSMFFYGVKDTKQVRDFFKKLVKKGKITFGSKSINILKLDFYGYNNILDEEYNIYFDIDGKIVDNKGQKLRRR